MTHVASRRWGARVHNGVVTSVSLGIPPSVKTRRPSSRPPAARPARCDWVTSPSAVTLP